MRELVELIFHSLFYLSKIFFFEPIAPKNRECGKKEISQVVQYSDSRFASPMGASMIMNGDLSISQDYNSSRRTS